MSAPVLEFNDVRKSYGKVEALKGLSFSVGPSELVGLLGPNGAGKSTLFQIAAGLFAPDGGEVKVFGLDYRRHSPEILSRLGVVFQSRSLDLDMTVKANLVFHGSLFGLSGRLLNDRINEIAGFFEIADLLKRPVRTLSGGNQRRVEVVRALLNMPSLLLLDEPSVGLDAPTRRSLIQRMERLREHASILWATHLVEEVESADRIVIVVGGEIVRIGTPAELIAATGTTTLADAYVALTGVRPTSAAQEGGDA